MIILASYNNSEINISFSSPEGIGISKRIERLSAGLDIEICGLKNPYFGSYDKALKGVKIHYGLGKIKAEIISDWVLINANETNAHVLASFFRFNPSQPIGSHHHFDIYGNEDYVDEKTAELVFSLGDNRELG